MPKIQRQYDFEQKLGKIISPTEVDNELDALVNAHNNQDDELLAHYSKQANETSSDTNKDKHVSNKQLKDIYDYIELSNVEIQVNKNEIGVERIRNDQQDNDIKGIVGAFLQDQKVVALRDSNDGKVYMLILRDGALDTVPIGTVANNIVTIDYSSLVATSSFVAYQQQVTTALSLKADKTYTDTELEKDRTRLTQLETVIEYTPTLQNGWAFEPSWGSKNTMLIKGNTVTFRFVLVSTSATANTIFTLPSIYAPTTTLYVAIHDNGDTLGTLQIASNGVVNTAKRTGGKLYITVTYQI